MKKQDLIDALLSAIEDSDRKKISTVTMDRGAAAEILSLLLRDREVREPDVDEAGKVLFYCSECGHSFRAVPREDAECLEKWHYHRWLANCPLCHAETARNDRYWR